MAMGEERAQRSEVKSQRSDVKPQRSDVKPQRSDVKPQRSDVKPQRSDVKSQRRQYRPFTALKVYFIYIFCGDNLTLAPSGLQFLGHDVFRHG
jgi:hypothetical protein